MERGMEKGGMCKKKGGKASEEGWIREEGKLF